MTPPKAKDGRETLQEQVRRSTARMANECSVRLDLWCEHSSVCLQLANDHDAAQAEIARLNGWIDQALEALVQAIETDGIFSSLPIESECPRAVIDAHDALRNAKKIVEAVQAPLPVAEDVVERLAHLACDNLLGGDCCRHAPDKSKCTAENCRAMKFASKSVSLLYQPEAAPEGLIRNAALQEAAAHLRDMGYWTQGAAVLSLCTDAFAPTPASAQSDSAVVREAFHKVDLREIILRNCTRMRQAGESYEMMARWVFTEFYNALPTSSPEAGRNAGLEEAAKWHDEREKYFLEREHYFTHGGGYRTHCRGSMGAEDAAKDFKNIAVVHRNSAKALRALASTPAPASAQDDWKPTHRHKKRGSTYVVVGQAQVQCEDGLTDYEVATVYRGHDGQLWVRRKSEFEDGRFEALSATGGAK